MVDCTSVDWSHEYDTIYTQTLFSHSFDSINLRVYSDILIYLVATEFLQNAVMRFIYSVISTSASRKMCHVTLVFIISERLL